MILLDFSQTVLATLLSHLGPHTNIKIEENMFRCMVLNNIRFYKQKFGAEYGELIVVTDSNNYWRKKIFPHYKANRKKLQAESELNWTEIFEFLDKVREELKQFFPYKVLDVETCEADDIIGTLIIKELGRHKYDVEVHLILSGDKDYIQLQVYNNVRQYDPVKKKWIRHENPARYLFEHILKGDTGDGIPNILSADNCLVAGIRQKHMTRKKLDAFRETAPALQGRKEFWRNEELISLWRVPEPLQDKILGQFHHQESKDRSRLMGYFMKYKLKNLMEYLSDY